jgi:hypothetical protein
MLRRALLDASSAMSRTLTRSSRKACACLRRSIFALFRLGECEDGEARGAVAAYRETLKEYTRERVPLDWTRTQMNLGGALARLGERESGTEKLEEAISARRSRASGRGAEGIYTRARSARLGDDAEQSGQCAPNALGAGEWEGASGGGGRAYREALEEYTQAAAPHRAGKFRSSERVAGCSGVISDRVHKWQVASIGYPCGLRGTFERSQLLLLPEAIDDYVGADNDKDRNFTKNSLEKFIKAVDKRLDEYLRRLYESDAKEAATDGLRTKNLAEKIEARRELLAVDGTRIKAVNNKDRNFTKNSLEKFIKAVDKRLDEYLRRLDESDAEEAATDGSRTKNLAERSRRREKRGRYGVLLAELERSGERMSSATTPSATPSSVRPARSCRRAMKASCGN